MDSWQPFYLPATAEDWFGRTDHVDGEYLHQVIRLFDCRNRLPVASAEFGFAVIGFACDEGIRRNQGRIGAAEGPRKVREYLGRLPMHCAEKARYLDFGTIVCNDERLEEAQAALGELVAMAMRAGLLPIVIGGGHETAWGAYQGVAKTPLARDLGIVNFDSHFDLRPVIDGRSHSGNAFTQIMDSRKQEGLSFDFSCFGIQPAANTSSLFARAQQFGVHYLLAEDLRNGGGTKGRSMIDAITQRRNALYLSISLDAFSSSLAPGVSAVQPLGLSVENLLPFIQRAAASGKVVLFEMAELSPRLDREDVTARLAAHIIWTFMHAATEGQVGHG